MKDTQYCLTFIYSRLSFPEETLTLSIHTMQVPGVALKWESGDLAKTLDISLKQFAV